MGALPTVFTAGYLFFLFPFRSNLTPFETSGEEGSCIQGPPGSLGCQGRERDPPELMPLAMFGNKADREPVWALALRPLTPLNGARSQASQEGRAQSSGFWKRRSGGRNHGSVDRVLYRRQRGERGDGRRGALGRHRPGVEFRLRPRFGGFGFGYVTSTKVTMSIRWKETTYVISTHHRTWLIAAAR